jgi:hypothetical protein
MTAISSNHARSKPTPFDGAMGLATADIATASLIARLSYL